MGKAEIKLWECSVPLEDVGPAFVGGKSRQCPWPAHCSESWEPVLGLRLPLLLLGHQQQSCDSNRFKGWFGLFYGP